MGNDRKGDKATTTTNKFDTLIDLIEEKQNEGEKTVGNESTKQWVEALFKKINEEHGSQ